VFAAVTAASVPIFMGVTAASVPIFMGVTAASVFTVMVVAVEIGSDLKRPVDKSFSDFPDIAGSSADYFDPGITERVDRAAADTAANEDFDLFKGEQRGERAVSGITAGKHFFRSYFPVNSFKYRKSRRMTEMLKDLIIFTSNCNFHISPLCNNCHELT